MWADVEAASQQYPNHNLTDEEEEDFQSATQCYLCENVDHELVRDHCHSTGTYRGAACAKCNSSLRLRSLACYAHNYQGFGSCAIIRALAQMDTTRQPNVINRASERQLCCSWENLSFRDSMSLMSGSLGKLIESARGKLEGEALAERFQLMAERHPIRRRRQRPVAAAAQAALPLLVAELPSLLRRRLPAATQRSLRG